MECVRSGYFIFSGRIFIFVTSVSTYPFFHNDIGRVTTVIPRGRNPNVYEENEGSAAETNIKRLEKELKVVEVELEP